MAVYIVTYDLTAPSKDYAPLLEAIRKYTNCYALKSAFFVDTLQDAATIRENLMRFLDLSDKLYVMNITRDWKSAHPDPTTEWLLSPLRTF